MKLVLEVKDSDAPFLLELLNRLDFVQFEEKRTKPYTKMVQEKTLEVKEGSEHSELDQLKKELSEAVTYVKKIKQGKYIAKPLKQLLDELQHTEYSAI
jgi:hypothetical protein